MVYTTDDTEVSELFISLVGGGGVERGRVKAEILKFWDLSEHFNDSSKLKDIVVYFMRSLKFCMKWKYMA
jgi:hypothetical protein